MYREILYQAECVTDVSEFLPAGEATRWYSSLRIYLHCKALSGCYMANTPTLIKLVNLRSWLLECFKRFSECFKRVARTEDLFK